jgi:hypothetical protein
MIMHARDQIATNHNQTGCMKVPITERVLIARMRRILRKAGEDLRMATPAQKAVGLGKYYLVDSKGIIDKDVDIEGLARKLQLLQPWETLSD